MIPLNVPKGARQRCSKNQLVQDELRRMISKGERRFTCRDLAKRTNHMSNGIGNILRFTTGVQREGKGLWKFTGEPVEVMV
jgi:hypothetical protein